MGNALSPRPTSEIAPGIALARVPSAPARRTGRAATTFGVLVILATLVGVGVWAAMAPLSSAVVAQGQVVVAGKRKQVQHRDGGIVRALHVRDGDAVARGAVLLELDDTEARTHVRVLQSKIAAAGEQLALLGDELGSVQNLHRVGLARKSRLLALKRRKSELESQREQDRLRLQMQQAVIARARIRSPAAGTVVDMRVHTLGGVIRAGDTLLEIVPGDDRLIVEARIRPTDVDDMALGLETEVRFAAFKQRTTPTLTGRVVHVSADALEDEQTGQSYFLSRIRIEREQLARLGELRLQPGLPAEILVKTGDRSVLAYLLQPILDSMNRALRES